jgi:adenylate kinase family enzyme
MTSRRIHVMGASGAGTTTLGRALAEALGIPHHDTDDYYWTPTTPPYRAKRDVAERLRLMREVFLGRAEWVLSGSVHDWGAAIVPFFDRVIFLIVPTEVRLTRLREREARRFGAEAVAPGGWRFDETEEFIEWASHYDDGSRDGRNLGRHETWLQTLSCPVMRLDGTRPTGELVAEIVAAVQRQTVVNDLLKH